MSKPPETPIWGIHAGRTGDADELFLQKNCVGLEWIKMSDLSTLAPDREAFKARVAETYPERPGAVPVNAGQLFRFVHEMKRGDLVAYRSATGKFISGELRVTIVTILKPSRVIPMCVP